MLHEKRMPWMLVVSAVGLLASVALGAGLVTFDDLAFLDPIVETLGLILIGAFGAMTFIMGIVLAGLVWFPGWWADQQGRPSSPVRMSFSRDGVVIDTANRHSEADWAFYDRFEEFEDYFLLREEDRTRYWSVIPKRAFSSADEQRRFREFLPERFGAARGHSDSAEVGF
ncbi:MAG: YcxB family protein [Bradymonadaceae bacterium]